ncbi:MAG: DUF4280 domain-containing protein [Planctomycetaceae bacterium]|nr:DUF4280 domain-containing protein [Planctomycetaceae bacterium]
MAQEVVLGAMTQCNQGTAPCTMVVLPANMVNGNYVAAANIMDYLPIVNLPTFGMCKSPANPTVAAATAAALGVLTPMPCIPMTVAPWSPGAPTVKIGMQPALNNSSKCTCAWGGSIEIKDAGQTTVNTP